MEILVEYSEILIKLSLAALLSLIIGLERELKKKPVGLKTSVVIATFSCLLTYISIEAAYMAEGRDGVNITMDPLRLAAQIVSGIGFLGAGVILRKGHDSISGLTTAAMIWGAGGIGIAVGAGFYIEAAFSVFVVLVGIEIIPPLLNKIGPKRLRMRDLSLHLWLKDANYIDDAIEYIQSQGGKIQDMQIRDHSLELIPQHELKLRISMVNKVKPNEFYHLLKKQPYIIAMEIEAID
ncbi:MgtC/SapB family protein [Chryseomicrobium sp. FSL W7-1435]|uniref:MgtC/SapB family protein n=1 Tax=Chryseomicrobium sp. FSL W7-1435 TaxID=2921704 RepID=UPI00315ACEB0